MQSTRSLFRPLLTASHFTPKKIPPIFPSVPSRSIVHVIDLKGLHSSSKKYSIFNGALFFNKENFYQLSKVSESKKPSACNRLMLELFFQREENYQFGVTHLESLPASYLTPHWFSQIIHHLEQDTLEKEKENLASAWHKSIKKKKSSNVRVKYSRVNRFLETLIEAKKETSNKQYPAYFVENILMSFILNKASSRSQLVDYLAAIPGMYESPPKKEEKFDNHDIAKGIELINAISYGDSPFDALFRYYEEVVAAVLLQAHELAEVMLSYYGLHDMPVLANCVEVAHHNLSNILLYDGKEGFDLKKLPANLKPHPLLVAFYKMHNTIYSVNLDIVGQDFYNLVSGINNKDIQYRRGNYGLIATSEYFIPIMNHLYGSTASSLEELSKQFSDDRREIIFTKEKNTDQDKIIIVFKENHQIQEKIKISYHKLSTGRHCHLDAPRFYRHQQELPLSFEYRCLEHIDDISLLYALVLINKFSTIQEESHSEAGFFHPKTWLYQMNYLFPINVYQAHKILVDNLSIKPKQPEMRLEQYAAYLNQQFPQLLALAVHQNNPSTIELLLKIGANPNSTDYFGNPSLLYDCRNMQMIKLLLQAGASFNVKDESSIALLCKIAGMALQENDVEFVSHLLEMGLDPNMRTDKGLPLIFFAKSKNMVTLLLAAGSQSNSVNDQGETPLFHANNFEIANLFLENGADIHAKNNKGETALTFILRLAIENDAIDFVKHLIKTSKLDLKHPIICYKEPSPYSVLLFSKSAQMTQLLLDAGADHNARDKDNTPLSVAANCDIAKILLDKGARWDDVKKSYETYYSDSNDIDVSKKKYILTDFFQKKQNKIIAHLLKIAIENNDIQFVKDYLIKKGALPYNDVLNDRETLPLGLCKSVEMVELLIEAGEKPNKLNPFNENALFQVSLPDVALALLQAGTDSSLTSSKRKDLIAHLKERNEKEKNLDELIKEIEKWKHNKEEPTVRLGFR